MNDKSETHLNHRGMAWTKCCIWGCIDTGFPPVKPSPSLSSALLVSNELVELSPSRALQRMRLDTIFHLWCIGGIGNHECIQSVSRGHATGQEGHERAPIVVVIHNHAFQQNTFQRIKGSSLGSFSAYVFPPPMSGSLSVNLNCTVAVRSRCVSPMAFYWM